MLAFALMSSGCIFEGSYTVVNQSDDYVLTEPSQLDCDKAAREQPSARTWQLVNPGSTVKVSAPFVDRCVAIADSQRLVMATERYSDSQVLTVHADRTVEASEFKGPKSFLGVLEPFPGAWHYYLVFLIASKVVALILAVPISAYFLYRYLRDRHSQGSKP